MGAVANKFPARRLTAEGGPAFAAKAKTEGGLCTPGAGLADYLGQSFAARRPLVLVINGPFFSFFGPRTLRFMPAVFGHRLASEPLTISRHPARR